MVNFFQIRFLTKIMKSSVRKNRIEFFTHHYGRKVLFIDDERTELNGCGVDILMEISKGFERRIADGDTIFFLTDRQLNKLKSILDV